MMKPLILTLSAAAWLLSACSADDGAVLPPVRPARVGMQVLEASMNDLQPASRADSKKTIEAGSIGVFLDNVSSGTDYDPKKNVCYTAEKDDAGTTVWNSDDALFFNTSTANVCAYYPYVNDDAYADSKKIPLTTQVYDAAYDLSYATNIPMNANENEATQGTPGNRVRFSMTHAYALLELNLTRGSLKDDVTISKIEITASGLNASNTLDITSGSYGTATALAGGTYAIDEEMLLTAGGSLKKSFLIVPMTITGQAELKFTFTLKNTGNPTMNPTMSATINTITQFEKAKKYIVNLTVNGTGLEASSVTILPWKEVNVTNTGGGSFIPLP